MSREPSAPELESALATLAEQASATEQRQRPTAGGLEAARQVGAFAMATPEAYGGRGGQATTMASLLETLARACPATSWIAGTCATSKIFAANVLPPAAQEEVFADPDALTGGSAVPAGRGTPVPGAVRVSGRWATISGCEDATWAGLGLLVDGTMSMALLPLTDVAVEHTWDAVGMRGTGSHTVVADDVLVPAHRVAPLARPSAADGLRFALTVLGPAVGAALGGLDAVEAMFASDRKPFMRAYASMGESSGARHWLADAAQHVTRARRTMLDAARAVEGDDLNPEDVARLRMDVADAARDCRVAMDRMLDLHGVSGFAAGNPLQRYWRDVAVASRHPHLNPYLAVEDYGRVLADTSTARALAAAFAISSARQEASLPLRG